jgi:hypothetical protein
MCATGNWAVAHQCADRASGQLNYRSVAVAQLVEAVDRTQDVGHSCRSQE